MPTLTAPGVTDSRAAARRWLTIDLSVAVLGLAALAAWDASGLDIAVTRTFGGAAGFAWRDHWLTASLMHSGLRAVAWLLFAAVLISPWRPWGLLRGTALRQRLWLIGTVLACAALIPLLKRVSATSCPWSLAEFGGGAARYVPHWVRGLTDGGPGGCFPSGHASSAFAFLAAWFVLRDTAPRAARVALLVTVVTGGMLGAVQVVRGAHYPSHPMWTAWICWMVAALSFHALRPWRSRLQGSSDP